ncbi:hypothetical protein HOD08_04655 [bacterium]|nr:hypothetical protein [bacterium]
MKVFSTLYVGLLLTNACGSGGTVDGLVHILHRFKSENQSSIKKKEAIKKVKKAYMSVASFFDTIEQKPQSKRAHFDSQYKKECLEKQYKRACRDFVEENLVLFEDGEFSAQVRILFATALFKEVLGNDKQAAALIFDPELPVNYIASSMYASIENTANPSTVDTWSAWLIAHAPFKHGQWHGFHWLAKKTKNSVKEVAHDIAEKKPNTLANLMQWEKGNEIWSPEIRKVLKSVKQQDVPSSSNDF